MLQQVNYTNIRDVQRNYRKISEAIRKTDKPIIVMSKNEPQFAIVSIKTLEKFQKVAVVNSAQKLLQLAVWGENQNFDLPDDLGVNHNKYAWGK
jgi:PHD/YefM family antitoxin component YafN of YafNO toxin-antitoxin module